MSDSKPLPKDFKMGALVLCNNGQSEKFMAKQAKKHGWWTPDQDTQ